MGNVSDWLTVGGLALGLASLVLGYVTYRHSRAVKMLDLRLELRNALGGVRTDVNRIPDLIDRYENEATRLAAATGLLRSGASIKRAESIAQDRDLARELIHRFLAAENGGGVSAMQSDLEASLVVTRDLQRDVSEMAGKYAAELERLAGEREAFQERER